MSKVQDQPSHQPPDESFFVRPEVGTGLTVLSGLAFMMVCMVLPVVGKAGAVTVHARQNTIGFVAAVSLCLLLAVLATWSKLKRRQLDQSPRPIFSIVLCALSVALLIVLATGLLHI